MYDLIDLYEKLPKELPDERTLDIFLTNLYQIKPWDRATLGAYRKIVYQYRFMVSPDLTQPRMVKGPPPPKMTADKQAELARQREAERFAERDRVAQDHIASVLEPRRREFESQLNEVIGDRLGTLEAAIAQLRAGE